VLALVGTLGGVLVGAWLSRQNAIKLLGVQTEHDAASDAELALYRLRQRINGMGDDGWGQLHNDLSDEVYVYLGRLRNPEVSARVDSVGYMIFLCFQYPDEALQYGALAAISDARRALQALLRSEPIPDAQFLAKQAIRDLLSIGTFPNFEGYHDWVEENAPSIE
jgi:hypothetical protein